VGLAELEGLFELFTKSSGGCPPSPPLPPASARKFLVFIALVHACRAINFIPNGLPAEISKQKT